jgi:hypothetical protein
MKLVCPNCSAELEGDVPVGELIDCPDCGTTFEARPAPPDEEELRRRMAAFDADIARQSAEARLKKDLERKAEGNALDRTIKALDDFGRGSQKIGCGLLQGVISLPILIFLLYVIWKSIF